MQTTPFLPVLHLSQASLDCGSLEEGSWLILSVLTPHGVWHTETGAQEAPSKCVLI